MMSSDGNYFGLAPSVIAMIQSVFAKYPPVTEVRLYGSRAKGTFGSGSDIDLSIMDEAVSGAQLMRIENDIEELPLPYSVDLSLFRRIDNPALSEHILRVGKVFYSARASI
jgi:predicted nucleotidyltransferase